MIAIVRPRRRRANGRVVAGVGIGAGGVLLGLGLVALGLGVVYELLPASAGSVLGIARSYLGVRESPAGSNHGPIVDQFNHGTGQAWCGWFVSTVLRKAGVAFIDLPSVADLHAKAARLGVLSPYPSPGAVFVHLTGTEITGGGFDHTGFVESIAPDASTFSTVEGNWDDSVASRTGVPRAGYAFIPFAALRAVFAP